MSISKINYDQAATDYTQLQIVQEPGTYLTTIIDAISKPNKAMNGTNLIVTFKIEQPKSHEGQVYSAFYAYEHPNPTVSSIAIREIKNLLHIFNLPLGSDEQQLLKRKCVIHLGFDRNQKLAIEQIKPYFPSPIKTMPTEPVKKPIFSMESQVNPFENESPF